MNTLMAQEISQTPTVVAAQAQQSSYGEAAARLREKNPASILTVARGTSDHAAEYLAYVLMRYAGLPFASIPLSLNTIYRAPWQAKDALVLALSQSGGSRDLVESVRHMKSCGLEAWSLLNVMDSPLAAVSDYCIDVGAGSERSVAATKSFIATATAGLRLFASHLEGSGIMDALEALPVRLDYALETDGTALTEALLQEERLYVVGRGAGLALAKEAALKCKETCLLQGEAFSGAEIKHGPWALMNVWQTVLIFAPPDEHQGDLLQLAQQCRDLGARVLLAADEKIKERDLTLVDAGHSALQPLTAMLSFYHWVEALSRARGIDTDSPPNLNKVTSTH